jgi:hypothetical protein
LLPTPVKPTWGELLNGRLDVQWAELAGLVTEVRSNTMSLFLPEGRLDVELDGLFESDLKRFEKSVVRIRGVLYAVWDQTTREVRVGRVMMRQATLSVDIPRPADPFEAVSRTPRELLRFDAQASAFRPVKVQGQIVYADSSQLFLQADGTGCACCRKRTDSRPAIWSGGRTSGHQQTELVLREALLRRIGRAIASGKKLDESGLPQGGSTQLAWAWTGSYSAGVPRKAVCFGNAIRYPPATRLFRPIAARTSATLPLRPGSRPGFGGSMSDEGKIKAPMPTVNPLNC